MAYNVQSAVDSKHHLILDYSVGMNPSDQGELSKMVKQVQRKLKLQRFIVVADKGYYSGEDLTKVKKLKVRAIVSRQKAGHPKEQPAALHTDKFSYNEAKDSYTCPMGKELTTRDSKKPQRRKYSNKQECKNCKYVDACTKSNNKFRTITRSIHSNIYDEVDKDTRNNMHIYNLRQQIVEHPFGTIKFAMGGYYFLLRTRRKVRSEIALLFLGYNLKRVYKVLGFKEIMTRLSSLSKGYFFIFYKSANNIAY